MNVSNILRRPYSQSRSCQSSDNVQDGLEVKFHIINLRQNQLIDLSRYRERSLTPNPRNKMIVGMVRPKRDITSVIPDSVLDFGLIIVQKKPVVVRSTEANPTSYIDLAETFLSSAT